MKDKIDTLANIKAVLPDNIDPVYKDMILSKISDCLDAIPMNEKMPRVIQIAKTQISTISTRVTVYGVTPDSFSLSVPEFRLDAEVNEHSGDEWLVSVCMKDEHMGNFLWYPYGGITLVKELIQLLEEKQASLTSSVSEIKRSFESGAGGNSQGMA